MSNKSRGLESERNCMRELEAQGYMAVHARGSLGMFDVVAMNEKVLILIQVKRVKKRPYGFKSVVKEIDEFHNHPENTRKELWVWVDKEGWEKFNIYSGQMWRKVE